MDVETTGSGNRRGLVAAGKVLVVDDEEPVRRLLQRLLTRAGYECDIAGSTAEARAAMTVDPFDLVLTDMTMPGESGLDLVLYLSESFPDVATVMVTGADDVGLATTALELGAYGYIVKPFEANEILINVANALRRRTLEMENRQTRDHLEQMVRERTSELWNAIAKLERAESETRASREETVHRLSMAAEFRDDGTERHIQRMSRYCGLLAELAGEDSELVDMIRVAAIMHDVGKIAIPDRILLKPGPLTPEERAEMQEHTTIGYRLLEGSASPFLQLAASIALTHHEWMDGSGYPNGLKAPDIPLEGRIAAIADVFDALSSDRVYKSAFPIGKAVDTMLEGAGSQFDPELLDLFLGSLDRVLGIREDYAGA